VESPIVVQLYYSNNVVEQKLEADIEQCNEPFELRESTHPFDHRS
jgi:hypothetical protein